MRLGVIGRARHVHNALIAQKLTSAQGCDRDDAEAVGVTLRAPAHHMEPPQ